MKWGESFLKSGLPFEHLTLMMLEDAGWVVMPHYEFRRADIEPGKTSEIDLLASPAVEGQPELRLLIECKYHDPSRDWMLLPSATEAHLSESESLSAGEAVETDPFFLNYAPYDPLVDGSTRTFYDSAPRSIWGSVLAKNGTRQHNELQKALHQVATALVPYILDYHYNFANNHPCAVVPMVVTSASLFRLREDIRTLDQVRSAEGPEEIAERVPWTWCYYSSPMWLKDRNMDLVDQWLHLSALPHYPKIGQQVYRLWAAPKWVAVINFEALIQATGLLRKLVEALPKDYSYTSALAGVRDAPEEKRLSKLPSFEEVRKGRGT